MTNERASHAAKVHLVGAGPGDPELLTRKAARLLESADVVLHDDLVPPPVLALAGRHAMLLNVGKRYGTKRITQHEINTLMIESARRGLSVVRLKGGDPGVFGRLAEELDALDAAGIEWEIVPGVTAAVAAAASLGASLTDRRTSSQILIVSGHRAGDREHASTDWRALARHVHDGTTIAVYMPGHDFTALRAELLAAGVDPSTPAAIVSRAATSSERTHRTTLAKLHVAPELPAPSILLIGRALQCALRETESRINAIDAPEFTEENFTNERNVTL